MVPCLYCLRLVFANRNEMIARVLQTFVAIVVVAAIVAGVGLAMYGARWILWAAVKLTGP